MATLIAHSNERKRQPAQHLAKTGEQRVLLLPRWRASRYVDTVDAVVVIAPAQDANSTVTPGLHGSSPCRIGK